GQGLGRDGCRTPMQWDDSAHAGFSTAVPWLPLADNYPLLNAAAERASADSMLALHRRLIALRNTHAALQRGSYQPIVASGDLLLYRREHGDDHVMVALNLGAEMATVALPVESAGAKLLLSTHGDRDGEFIGKELALRAHEGVVVERRA